MDYFATICQVLYLYIPSIHMADGKNLGLKSITHPLSLWDFTLRPNIFDTIFVVRVSTIQPVCKKNNCTYVVLNTDLNASFLGSIKYS